MPETTCTGIEVIPTEDGPDVRACLCGRCTGRAQIQRRYVEPGFTAELLADMSEDDPW
jgi:hypothetical protein